MLTPELCSPPADCMSTPITPSNLSDSLLITTPEQFYLCLSDLILQKSLARVLELPLPTEHLQMVKKKLLEVMDEAGQGLLLGPLVGTGGTGVWALLGAGGAQRWAGARGDAPWCPAKQQGVWGLGTAWARQRGSRVGK